MATVILGIAGAAGGALIAGPAGAWKGAEIGWAIGTTIGGIIDRPKYPEQSYGRLSDLRVTTSSYGNVLPRVWGKVRVPGNVIWSTELKEHETDQSAGGGGSGGGGGQKTQVYTYTVSFALSLAKGGRLNASSVKRIWGDDEIIYDSSSGSLPSHIRWYYGTNSQTADPLITAQYGTDAPAFRNTAYLVFQDLLLTDFGSRIPNISVELDTGTITLDQVVSDTCSYVGLTSADIDVSQATNTTIDGVVMNSRMSAKDALQPILSAYAFDMIDVDGVLRLVERGGPPVAEIAWSDMGAVTGNTGTQQAASRITKKRTMEWELPKRVDVTYYSLLNDFQQASQGAVRQTVQSSQYTTVSLPMSLDDDFARGVAERELYLAWTERNSFQTAVLPKFTYLSPADPVLADIDNSGNLVRCRIDDMETGVFGEIRLTLVRDDEQAYIQSVGASAPIGGTATPSNVPTSFFAWSGLELQDSDFGQAGFYVAATGVDGWRGCAVYYSLDGGSSYILAGRIGTRSNFGVLATTLALSTALSTSGFDTTGSSTCNVTLNSPGTLTSTSEASVSAGIGNFAVITKADQSTSDVSDYEVVGFASASLVSGTTYTISDMKRRLRSTAGSSHPAGDAFVQVTTDIMRVVVPNAQIGHTVLVKCLSPYQMLTDVSPQTVYINTPTPSAISSVITTVNTAIAGIPKMPFWRCKIWYGDGISSGSTHIDHTYFDGSNVPSGKTVFSFSKYALGPGGSFFHETPGLIAAIYGKIGITNTTSSPITVNWHVPGYDNGFTAVWNGTNLIQEGDSDSGNHHASLVTGTFSVAANSSGYLEVAGYNIQDSGKVYSPSNQSQMIFMMDGFDNAGLSFFDGNTAVATGITDSPTGGGDTPVGGSPVGASPGGATPVSGGTATPESGG